ncbi:cysteine-rich CWC family protein [Roseateles sp. LYH14W]|uniref:Cysteine-rich CWC family protein n=1 Tax=Pelomonas parva TaxID=3299032 RepID=A0ABW7F0N3_9BURK
MSGDPLAATCPRCGGGFECGASTGHCDCFDLRLTDTLRAELAARYPGACLCLRCLRELMQAGSAPPAPARG